MSKRKIIVGSLNPVKVGSIKVIFDEDEVEGFNAPSGVAPQPYGDEETLQGAINRAQASKAHGAIGIGLEGGVARTPYGLFVINYGALIDEEGRLYIAGGTRIPLPKEVEKQLHQGLELGDVMDRYTKKKGVKHDEGAVGVFTKQLVKRQEMFEHIAKCLKGQYLTGNWIEQGGESQ